MIRYFSAVAERHSDNKVQKWMEQDARDSLGENEKSIKRRRTSRVEENNMSDSDESKEHAENDVIEILDSDSESSDVSFTNSERDAVDFEDASCREMVRSDDDKSSEEESVEFQDSGNEDMSEDDNNSSVDEGSQNEADKIEFQDSGNEDMSEDANNSSTEEDSQNGADKVEFQDSDNEDVSEIDSNDSAGEDSQHGAGRIEAQVSDNEGMNGDYNEDQNEDELIENHISDNSESGSDIDADSDDDAYFSDEDEEIRNEQINIIKRSRLAMEIQGFRASSSSKTVRIDDSEDGAETSSEKNAEIFDPAHVQMNNRFFFKHRCYSYFSKENPEKEKIVGILHFVSKEVAKCILVVEISKTFVKSGSESTRPSDEEGLLREGFLQVHKEVIDINLADIGDEKLNYLPKLIYEPQRSGGDKNWCRFGYFLDRRNFRRGKRRERIRSLEFFAGCGGSLQGYHNNHFETVMAIEKDDDAVKTLKANNEDVPVYHGCIKDFLKDYDILKCALGRIDHVHFSPPCKGFSTANRNQTMTDKDKENNDLSLLIIDIIRKTSCDTAIFENVEGMWRDKNIDYVKQIVSGILKLNYQVRVCSLKACDYGNAQKRPRFFMVISKHSVPLPNLPQKTHGKETYLEDYVTTRHVIGFLLDQKDDPNLKNMNVKTTSVKVGQHGLVRLDPNGLSPSIRSNSLQPLHYLETENRCISVREAACIQGFPIDYEFHGTINSQYKQVGNAVPIELGNPIACCVRDVLMYEYQDS